MFCVITSYSIHYTKLYELAGGDGIHKNLLVQLVGDGDIDSLYFRKSQQVAVIGKYMLNGGNALKPLGVIGIDIAYGDDS